RALRIWSAGCSSGQEPYTIAMVTRSLPELADWDVRVLAADVSAGMLSKARAGRYAQIEVNRGLPTELLNEHFERDGVGWRLKDDLKRTVEFRRLNLAASEIDTEAAPDVIFLRNVLAAFDAETQRR